ncbi:MAG: hypothetical protein ACTSRP_01960 [Candidatus Helarchaeota archaeon]
MSFKEYYPPIGISQFAKYIRENFRDLLNNMNILEALEEHYLFQGQVGKYIINENSAPAIWVFNLNKDYGYTTHTLITIDSSIVGQDFSIIGWESPPTVIINSNITLGASGRLGTDIVLFDVEPRKNYANGSGSTFTTNDLANVRYIVANRLLFSVKNYVYHEYDDTIDVTFYLYETCNMASYVDNYQGKEHVWSNDTNYIPGYAIFETGEYYFENCKIDGLNNTITFYYPKSVKFKNCDISNLIIRQVSYSPIFFENCRLRNVFLSGSFGDTHLYNFAIFDNCELEYITRIFNEENSSGIINKSRLKNELWAWTNYENVIINDSIIELGSEENIPNSFSKCIINESSMISADFIGNVYMGSLSDMKLNDSRSNCTFTSIDASFINNSMVTADAIYYENYFNYVMWEGL